MRIFNADVSTVSNPPPNDALQIPRYSLRDRAM